jgi:hypothetical protein
MSYWTLKKEPSRAVAALTHDTLQRNDIRGCIQKFPEGADNEINNNNNNHSSRSNRKGYGGKTRWTDSQNSDTAAPKVENCTICSSRSRWSVMKLFDTPPYSYNCALRS